MSELTQWMESYQWNWFDVLVGGLVLYSGVRSFLNGFIADSIGSLGWIVSIGASLVAPRYLQSYTDQALALLNIPYDLGFELTVVVTFIACLLVFAMITQTVKKLVGLAGLGAFDRGLGFFWGMGKAFLLLSLVYLGVMTYAPALLGELASLEASLSYQGIEILAQWLKEEYSQIF